MSVVRSGFTVVVGGLAAAVGYQAAPEQPADLILTNGKIVTVESAGGQAQAIAVRGDRIVALGSSAQIKRHTGPSTQVIDLQEAGHPWIRRRARTLHWRQRDPLNLNLMRATSWDEIVAMVAEAAKKAKPGEWIRGRGWHQEKWTKKPDPGVEGFPTHHSLSGRQ